MEVPYYLNCPPAACTISSRGCPACSCSISRYGFTSSNDMITRIPLRAAAFRMSPLGPAPLQSVVDMAISPNHPIPLPPFKRVPQFPKCSLQVSQCDKWVGFRSLRKYKGIYSYSYGTPESFPNPVQLGSLAQQRCKVLVISVVLACCLFTELSVHRYGDISNSLEFIN